MSGIATAIVGSAAIGAISSNSAANTQADAANNASAASQAQFNTINNQQAPWRQAGQNALSQIADMNPQFTHQFNASDLNSNLAPNYQFQLQQGQGAVKNLANSTGGLIGGNALKGIEDYTQNYAANAYQQAYNNYSNNQTNIFNRLSSIAGLGQTANESTANAGTAATQASNNYLTSGAAASAAGQVGVGNSISNGLDTWASLKYLTPPPPPAAPITT